MRKQRSHDIISGRGCQNFSRVRALLISSTPFHEILATALGGFHETHLWICHLSGTNLCVVKQSRYIVCIQYTYGFVPRTFEHPGVKAPGTANRIPFLPANMSFTSTIIFGLPSCNFTDGRTSPT